jgi:hypothetical protein
MVPPKRTIRGSQNIRTLSGRADDKFLPHKVFLRVACLEMERERRGQEHRSAMRRVRIIDERFREIDAEKRDLMAGMTGQGPAPVPGDPSAGKSPGGGSGFKFKY